MTKSPEQAERELELLKQENALLKKLLREHNIPWEHETDETRTLFGSPRAETAKLDEDRISTFRDLFRGRPDVFAIRWESSTGRSGYSPACKNEWKRGLCSKPRVRCAECENRELLPLNENVISDHLEGRHIIGIYPLLDSDSCLFLAADFDGTDWREDVLAFRNSCEDHGIPVALEISRSGNGAHAWIFFSEPVPAAGARQLGAALVSHTCSSKRQLELSSYDRFFPNQDKLPRGGFGNLIALPLQKYAREIGRTVFVDEHFRPFADQWEYLASVQKMSREDLESSILRVSGGKHPLDVAMILEEEDEPWIRPERDPGKIPGPLPESLNIILAEKIFFEKETLSQPLSNRLIRLAAFQNPEFYKAQAMRFSVWNKPRVIGCAENYPKHIALPRGCLDPAFSLLEKNGIRMTIDDKRRSGRAIETVFTGELRKDQEEAVKALLEHEFGILCAPTAFGKTVVAASVISRRAVSALVLVHRTDLLRQWEEQLSNLLEIQDGDLGFLGGGKKKPGGVVDIAVMQTLARMKDLPGFLQNYGHIVVDECHHISAFSFEAIMKQAKAKYVTGLTATPIRRDGHHPIIFMQCGPIRHNAERTFKTKDKMQVFPRMISSTGVSQVMDIHDLYRGIIQSEKRNRLIVNDVFAAYLEGRKILLLTERTQHLEILVDALGEQIKNLFVLHGRLPKKDREAVFKELGDIDDSQPRVIMATGKLIGEGFDHPPLDTLILGMPISWKGTLQQYAGRLHRDLAVKNDVRIYDYVESDNPVLTRMWEKRLRGYRALGYQISPPKGLF